jgi:hypothetical protein
MPAKALEHPPSTGNATELCLVALEHSPSSAFGAQ